MTETILRAPRAVRATTLAVTIATLATVQSCSHPASQPAAPAPRPAPSPSAPAAAASMPALPPGMVSSQSGLGTADQAKQGNDLFDLKCITCHQATYLTSGEFKKEWTGKNVFQYFAYVRATMPQDDPHSLSDAQYVLAVTYLLRTMGSPAGSVALAPDSAAMSKIRIDTIAGRSVPRTR